MLDNEYHCHRSIDRSIEWGDAGSALETARLSDLPVRIAAHDRELSALIMDDPFQGATILMDWSMDTFLGSSRLRANVGITGIVCD